MGLPFGMWLFLATVTNSTYKKLDKSQLSISASVVINPHHKHTKTNVIRLNL
jgi:hypothetical protein